MHHDQGVVLWDRVSNLCWDIHSSYENVDLDPTILTSLEAAGLGSSPCHQCGTCRWSLRLLASV